MKLSTRKRYRHVRGKGTDFLYLRPLIKKPLVVGCATVDNFYFSGRRRKQSAFFQRAVSTALEKGFVLSEPDHTRLRIS